MWAIRRGCSLHPQFKDLVISELNTGTPRIPRPLKTIWRLICAELATNSRHRSARALYAWAGQFKRFGWDITLKRELLHLLRPRVYFRESFRHRLSRQEGENSQQGTESELHVRDYVDWEVCLNIGEHPWEALKGIKSHGDWTRAAVECLPNFTTCLQEALDLMAELEGASEKSDLSYIQRPSIIDHEQNNDFREWTCLVELCRDAWLCAATENPPLARSELERWKRIKYPLFRRLVFFAAAETTLIQPAEALPLLVQDKGWWLWSSETQREVFRLLLVLAPKGGFSVAAHNHASRHSSTKQVHSRKSLFCS